MKSAFARSAAVYEKFGAEAPYYAVLTLDRFKGDNLDQDEFFQTGEQLVDLRMQGIADRGIQVKRSRALDFGCGVGRLTNGLARHFERVVGVDISSTMVAAAKDAQRRENCAFVTNKRDDLSMFNENVFDLIYSDITIQHIPAPASETYIREFFRILAPGGLAVFLVPDGPVLQPGTVHHRFETFYREQFRPFYKRVRGKQQVQVHRLACERVQQLITESGGQLLDVEVHPDWVNKSKRYKPLYYWAMKPAA